MKAGTIYTIADLARLPGTVTRETTNLFVLQVTALDQPGRWLDYASIKDTDDMIHAKRILSRDPDQYRILQVGHLP